MNASQSRLIMASLNRCARSTASEVVDSSVIGALSPDAPRLFAFRSSATVRGTAEQTPEMDDKQV
jgi:hypothetical protein